MVEAPTIQKDPAEDAIKKRAEEDKIAAIQKRVGIETRDILKLYGVRGALGGAKGFAPLSQMPTDSIYAGAFA